MHLDGKWWLTHTHTHANEHAYAHAHNECQCLNYTSSYTTTFAQVFLHQLHSAVWAVHVNIILIVSVIKWITNQILRSCFFVCWFSHMCLLWCFRTYCPLCVHVYRTQDKDPFWSIPKPPPLGSAHKTSCSAVNYSCPNTAITMSNLQPLYSQSPIKGNDIHAYPQQQHAHTDSRPPTGRGCNRTCPWFGMEKEPVYIQMAIQPSNR